MPEAPDQEPSIEEILASIRQIISDDDDDSDKAPPPPAPKPEPIPEPEPEPEDDILDLTHKVDEPVEIDMAEPEPEPEPEPEYVPEPVFERPAPRSMEPDDSLISPPTAAASLESFARLTRDVGIERPTHRAGITLEDIVRDMMRPMLRDWLDQNLPGMIEKMVQRELDRLSRKVADD